MQPQNLSQLLSKPIPFWKKFLAILLILFGSFLTGCSDQQRTGDKREDLTTGVTIQKISPDTSTATACTETVGFTEPIIIDDTRIDTVMIGKIEEVDSSGEIPNAISMGEIRMDLVKTSDQLKPRIDSLKEITQGTDAPAFNISSCGVKNLNFPALKKITV